MSYREMNWSCSDGTNLFACTWKPEGAATPKAVVGLVHGMGEHSGRYRHVAERLVDAGYVVFAYDQRGHGRTTGKRGHSPSYEALLEGVDRLLAEAKKEYPELPFILFGHSMGGNVALNYVLRRNPQIFAAIASGPWLKLAFNPPALELALAKMIRNIYPTFTTKRPMKGDHLTTDPEMMRIYKEDPLGHGDITAGFFFSMYEAGLWAIEHANELHVPLLLMHGDNDQVTSIAASREFAERARDLVTFREWRGFKHELHNESKREEVFNYMIDWLDSRLL